MNPNQVINDIKFLKKLGNGAFSSVWLAEHQITQKNLAVKIIPNSNDDTTKTADTNAITNGTTNVSNENQSNTQNQGNPQETISASHKNTKAICNLSTELQIISTIDHPLVCSFFGHFEDDNNFYICMENVPNGTLLNYINDNSTEPEGGLKETVCRRLFTELFVVIEFLHRHLKIFHRDLKCENILLDEHNNIKLIDFGFSTFYTSPAQTFTEKFGSTGYTCPEMLQNLPYRPEEADIWSLGVILYCMLVGRLPFQGNSDIEIGESIVFAEPQYPSFLSANSKDLLTKILTKNPQKRISFDGIRKHPFLSHTELSMISRLNPNVNLSKGLNKDIIMRMSLYKGVDIHKVKPGQNNNEMVIYKQLSALMVANLIDDVILGEIQCLRQGKKHHKHHVHHSNKRDQSSDIDETKPIPQSTSLTLVHRNNLIENESNKSEAESEYVNCSIGTFIESDNGSSDVTENEMLPEDESPMRDQSAPNLHKYYDDGSDHTSETSPKLKIPEQKGDFFRISPTPNSARRSPYSNSNWTLPSNPSTPSPFPTSASISSFASHRRGSKFALNQVRITPKKNPLTRISAITSKGNDFLSTLK